MKKLLKTLALLLVGFVVLAGSAAIVAPYVLDPNDHRERIATILGARTGRAVRLDGPLSLSVFPWLGVDAREVVIGNAPGFDDPLFARAERIEVRVKLLPLLGRAVEMDTVKATGVQIRLALDATGRGNWEDLTRGGGETGGGALAALALDGVEIAGGDLFWDDARRGEHFEVRGLDLRTGALELGAPIPFAAGFDLVSRAPALAGRISANGTLAFDPGTGRSAVRSLDASAELAGDGVPSGKASLAMTGAATYDPAARRVETDALDVTIALTGDSAAGGGLRLGVRTDAGYGLAERVLDASALEVRASGIESGGLVANVTASGPVRADLVARTVDAQGFAIAADARGENLPGGEIAAQASANLRLDLSAQTLALTDLTITSPAIALAGFANGSATPADGLAGTVRVALTADTVAAGLASRRLRATGLALRGEALADRLPGGSLPFSIGADLDVDLEASRASLAGLTLAAGDLRATGEVIIEERDGAPRAKATLALAGADPRALAALAGASLPATQDPDVLGALAGEATFTAGAAGLDVERMHLQLDDSTIRGSVRLPAFALPGARFDLAVDRLDVDRYLPPGTAPAAASPGAAAAGAATLPVEQLRALDLAGRLRVGSLRAGGVSLAKVDARIETDDGLVRLSPVSAALYGGTYAGNVTLDARREQVAVALDERIDGVDARALARALGADPDALGLAAGKSGLRLAGTATGDPDAGRYRLREVALEADVAGARFPAGRLSFGLGGAFDVDVPAGTTTSDGFGLRFGGLAAEGKLAVTQMFTDPHVAGTVETGRFNPRDLFAALGVAPPVTADPRALTSATLRTTVTASSRAVSLRALRLEVDQTQIAGDLEVRGFDPLAIRADLDVDAIVADRYLPPRSPGMAAPPGAAVALLPVETLRALDFDGEVRIRELTLGGVRASNAHVTAKAKDGATRIHPLGASLYGGTYAGDVRIDANDDVPRLSLDERLSGVAIDRLIADSTGRPSRLSGRTEFVARLMARGESTEALKRTLSGDASLTLTDGAFHGMDLTRKICDALAGRASGAAGEGDGALTRFTSLTATATARDGLLVSEDLDVASPLLRISGAGRASVVTEQLDVGARVMLEDQCRSEGGTRLTAGDAAQVNRSGVPIRCQGTFSRPGCGPDMEYLTRMVAQRFIERAVGGSLGGAIPGGAGAPGAGAGGAANPGDAINSILQGILRRQ